MSDVTRRLVEVGREPRLAAKRSEFDGPYKNELARMTKLIRDLGIPR